ncbi:MAG TPA: SET domain-containing protein-lysine N-methyltransferase [Candidatus Acidoferrum sp.]|jgi:hypothetical protein|nr:SET domain-containing protein-lysine N-methyltransferase [Candidatus Acidoferrum sp.]
MTSTDAHSVLTDLPSMPPGYLAFADFSNDIIRIGRCDLGHGIFANKNIMAGETILTFDGPYINFLQTKTKGSWECMPLQIDDNLYIDTLPVGVFVNHSCAPNAGIKRDKDLVALRLIRESEEIRFDYSTTMQENSFTMKCRCGQPTCRQIVDDFRTIPKAQQLAYLRMEVVMSFISKKYLTKK